MPILTYCVCAVACDFTLFIQLYFVPIHFIKLSLDFGQAVIFYVSNVILELLFTNITLIL